MWTILKNLKMDHNRNLSLIRILLGTLEEAQSEKHSSRLVVQ